MLIKITRGSGFAMRGQLLASALLVTSFALADTVIATRFQSVVFRILKNNLALISVRNIETGTLRDKNILPYCIFFRI
jgi:hypothetical protein